MLGFQHDDLRRLLRAVNVGGTGKLPMSDLKSMCSDLGFASVETYIASGNVVFTSKSSATRAKADLEARLLDYAGKRVGVVVRTASEMRSVLLGNPFPEAPPNLTYTIFLDEPPLGVKDEEMQLGRREIYVYYGSGMRRSKLRIPAAKSGTARNMNTVTKLAEMTSRL